MTLQTLLAALGAAVAALIAAVIYGHRQGRIAARAKHNEAVVKMAREFETIEAAHLAASAEVRAKAKMDVLRKVDGLEKIIGRRLTFAELESASKAAEDALHRALAGGE